ncbi:S8 family peptidase [Actinopolymorpha alba]|uniref:S8 family peptidase n=1 Tax=Actinopolymorpha alba TaxID=533267 RepID=UPI0004758034|nr:S8 family serine peptidase [Actinopolymorpha alba]
MSRALALATPGVIVTGLLMVGAAPAMPATADSPGRSTAPEQPATRPDEARTVTLLTGARVRVDPVAKGRNAVTVVPNDDGARANVKVVQSHGDLYAFPDEVVAGVSSGALDRELFNLTGLIEQGLDDAHQSALPVLITYTGEPPQRGTNAGPAPQGLPGTTRTATLESINAIAATTDKAAARDFWRAVSGRAAPTTQAPQRLANGIKKIWLDRKVTADLAESVPQIGAPAAWQAGFDGTGVTVAVLDTGIDAAHPDLAGKVVGSRDFTGTGSGTVKDGHGHGTHVASTIAGSGAAAGGARKGVAPGARLLVGKALDDSGSGQNSWLIDAMEWAATSGADIVSMSLSSEATDGSDPLSQAVNNLTASTGTLFVAAAGNQGPSDQTVRNPGTADAALTVGAVDKSDQLADFSSRGPRLGDYAIKPDITAPGVAIVAARADGTTMGTPVDARYTTASGTSMATPHVAGAAAILLQQHPDWDPGQLKSALVSTARPHSDLSVYQQGGGRVDIGRAVTSQVYAHPGTLDLGRFDWPHDGSDPPVARTITYTNTSPREVTLDLAVPVSGKEGATPPPGMFTLSAPRVVVPANGTSEVTLTLDPTLGEPDLYGGYVTAATPDGEVLAHTSVGLYKEPRMVELTVEAIAHDGRTAAGSSSVDLWNLDTDAWETGYFGGKGGSSKPATFRVRPGTYSLMAYLFTLDEPNLAGREVALVGQPELVITDDTRIVLDGRTANKLVVATPKPTEHQGVTVSYHRAAEKEWFTLSYLLDKYVDVVYAAPTARVGRGEFEMYTQWEMFAPEIALAVRGTDARVETEYTIGSPKIDGRQALGVVAAPENATLDDLARLPAKGKAVLVQRSDERSIDAQVRAAAAAGARAVIVHHDRPGWLLGRVDAGSPVPSFTISATEGARWRDKLRATGSLTLDLTGVAVSPYLYDLMLPEQGRIPARPSYDISSRNTARLDTNIHAGTQGQASTEARHGFRPHTTFSLRIPRKLPLPLHRTEWVSAGDTRWQQLVWPNPSLRGGLADPLRSYRAGTTRERGWFRSVVRPGVPDEVERYAGYGFPGYREGDELTIGIREFLDASGGYGDASAGDDVRARLYRDGDLVLERDGVYGEWPAAAGRATYQLDLSVSRDAPWWQHSTATETSWTFTSQRPAAGERAFLPLLQVDYDLDVDLLNRVKPSGPLPISLDVHRQARVAKASVAGAKVWVSADGGAHWTPVDRVKSEGGGRYTATVVHPPGGGAGERWMSLRVRAWDTSGNAIDQTVHQAYRLAAR